MRSFMRSSILVVVLLLATGLTGCLVGERPVLDDTDADGLPDDFERQGWVVRVYTHVVSCTEPSSGPRPVHVYNVTSNPLIDDNDTDGLLDLFEFQMRADPNLADTDGDGLSDKEEFDLRSSTSLYFGQRLSLTDVDSDQDCLSDKQELDGFEIPGIGHRTTDPTTSDTDSDGLSDYKEVFVSRTDPRNPDTDGDGVADGLDLDPLMDVGIAFVLKSVRVTSNPSGRTDTHLSFDGLIGSTSFRPSAPVAVSRDQTRSLPANASTGPLDVDDATGGDPVQVTVSWYEVDDQGRITGVYDFRSWPGTDPTITLRIHPTSKTWTIPDYSGGWSTTSGGCRLQGPHGEFVFTLHVGDATKDPSTWMSYCG
jgi:hypothetical protein